MGSGDDAGSETKDLIDLTEADCGLNCKQLTKTLGSHAPSIPEAMSLEIEFWLKFLFPWLKGSSM